MLRIGKNLTNDLVIKDRAAEDFHCILYLAKGELVVEDLKSHYGTLVNGSRITHAILYPGDELQIGFTRIEWQKLMPALQAIGDNSDAESFLQSQDLNLEVREEKLIPDNNPIDSFVIGDYTKDSTNELIEKIQQELTLKELDYPVLVKISSDDEVIESQLPSSGGIDSSSTKVSETNIEPQKPEISSIKNKSAKKKYPYRMYYFALIIMLAVMLLSGVLIALITG